RSEPCSVARPRSDGGATSAHCLVLERPIEREGLDRCRTRHEALAAGRDRRRDKAQRSGEIGDTLLGRAGAGLGGAPIAFPLLKQLLDAFDLCAEEIELARPHRAESLPRDAQLLAILKRLLIHHSRALFGLSAHAIDLAQLRARANELLDRPLELARHRRRPVP